MICECKCKRLSISAGISDPRSQHQVSSRSQSDSQTILKAKQAMRIIIINITFMGVL
ncbi:hypothetical protein Hanom_Chr10g00953691 [Helianthus anomalus]